jgi:hypothetical protein
MNKPVWTKEKISAGFQRFFDEHGHYPTVTEIDACPYLPQTRTLQRRFDGAKAFRGLLGLSVTDYGAGEIRTDMAHKIGKRGLSEEMKVYTRLVDHFGEIFVHAQKPFAGGHKRVDFFVYAKGMQFGVDIFYPESYATFTRCINIKERSLVELNFLMILLVANKNLSQPEIDRYVSNRKRPLPQNVVIQSMETFARFTEALTPLKLAEEVL